LRSQAIAKAETVRGNAASRTGRSVAVRQSLAGLSYQGP
jgi:hypothetical protein